MAKQQKRRVSDKTAVVSGVFRTRRAARAVERQVQARLDGDGIHGGALLVDGPGGRPLVVTAPDWMRGVRVERAFRAYGREGVDATGKPVKRAARHAVQYVLVGTGRKGS